MDLALNNPQRLLCHKTQQTQQKSVIDQFYFFQKNSLGKSHTDEDDVPTLENGFGSFQLTLVIVKVMKQTFIFRLSS